MAVKPNERIEFFLAKAAGEDIDTKTLTPPGAINAIERALEKISDRIDDIEDSVDESNAGGGTLIVSVALTVDDKTGNSVYTLDKTWQEIYDAVCDGIVPVVLMLGDNMSMIDIVRGAGYDAEAGYLVITLLETYYTAETTGAYPSYVQEQSQPAQPINDPYDPGNSAGV